MVSRAVDGVVFDGGKDIEARPLESEAHAAGTREQIDCNRPFLHLGGPLVTSTASNIVSPFARRGLSLAL